MIKLKGEEMNKWINQHLHHPDYQKLGLEKITLKDRELYIHYMANTDYDISSWSGNFTYIWAHNFSKQLMIYKTLIDEMLVTFILTKKGRLFLPCLPFGRGDPNKVINVLIKCGKLCHAWNKESNFLHKSLVIHLISPPKIFTTR